MTRPLPDCKRRHSHTIYQSPEVRLFYVIDANFTEHQFACSRDTNRRFSMGVVYEDDSDYIFDFRERGPWLAFLDHWSTKYGNEGMALAALNLRTGRWNTGGERGFNVIHGYGLTRRGSIAWIESSDPEYGGSDAGVYKVHEQVAGHDPVVLDSGPDVDPESLAVGGRHVYWVRAGAVRTAPIP